MNAALDFVEPDVPGELDAYEAELTEIDEAIANDERFGNVMDDVRMERLSQDEKWGQQNHPDGTGKPAAVFKANDARDTADANAKNGTITWADIANEEFFEALAETDPVLLRKELVQTTAVLVAWIEAIDRRAR